MKLYIVNFENFGAGGDEDFILFSRENIIDAAYLPNVKYFTKEDIEEFKEKFGVDLIELSEKGESIGHIKEKMEEVEDYDVIDEIDDFIRELNYLPQCRASLYCEDIIEKKDIEELEAEGVLFFDTLNDVLYSVQSDVDFDEYYVFWDGSSHNCLKIVDIEEVEVEEIEDEWYVDGDTYHYLYYKRVDNGKIFRVYVSHYQGTIPVLDEGWEINIRSQEGKLWKN